MNLIKRVIISTIVMLVSCVGTLSVSTSGMIREKLHKGISWGDSKNQLKVYLKKLKIQIMLFLQIIVLV